MHDQIIGKLMQLMNNIRQGHIITLGMAKSKENRWIESGHTRNHRDLWHAILHFAEIARHLTNIMACRACCGVGALAEKPEYTESTLILFASRVPASRARPVGQLIQVANSLAGSACWGGWAGWASTGTAWNQGMGLGWLGKYYWNRVEPGYGAGCANHSFVPCWQCRAKG